MKSEHFEQPFFTVSMLPTDLHSDKTVLFPLSSVSVIWGENNGN